MKYGPIIGAGAMFSLACSWAALIMAPQIQLGALAPEPLPNSTEVYPQTRSGLAAQGAEVYRSLGCVQCHTRALRQDSLRFGARLNEVGNAASTFNLAQQGSQAEAVNLDVLLGLARVRPDLAIAPIALPPTLAGDTNAVAKFKQFTDEVALLKRNDKKLGIARPDSGRSVMELAAKRPALVLELVDVDTAERAVKLLTDAGAKAELTFYNHGPDLDRGWGARRSVARDYVNDSPVLLGSVRVGPDLAGIGLRAPEKFAAPWKFATPTNAAVELEHRLLVHLYNPRLLAKESVCPSASYLFDAKKPQVRGVGESLSLPGNDSPVFPKHDALALVSYLMTQRLSIGVVEAPVPTKPSAAAPVAPSGTNSPVKP